MQNSALSVSENFRKMATKSVLSIILFVFTYIILIIMGIGIVFLCGFIAYQIVMFESNFITAMIALGFIGMGLLIFFFLIKFIFSSTKKIDRSHLVEITEKEQPELFKLIREIVTEVKTNLPKKVYLSSNVNASVFYDSNFWSMFFPVRKNLQIGLGLMNAISVIELKAILAHEFGHFSQRSMKVGSYVHNVNKLIYNLLYDNEGYDSLLNGWSNMSAYFALSAKGSIKVIQGIQYVLIKVYTMLNLNYMALSREMEFHADAVAASVAGSQPLVNSLLRLELADQSLNTVFNYYDSKISESQRTDNFYPQQYFVLNQIALYEGLPIQDGLPILSIDEYKKFNKTKLILDDQWSSHPSTELRVAKLIALNQPTKDTYDGIAIDLLLDKEAFQELVTALTFVNVNYETEPTLVGPTEFIAEHLKLEQENSYPAVFKKYFDDRNPYKDFSEEDFNSPVSDLTLTFEELINPQIIAIINDRNIAVSDKNTLENIYNGGLETESFDYDGIRYSAVDANTLLTFLDDEITKYNKILDKTDADLFKFFLSKSLEQNSSKDFKTHYLAYQARAAHLEAQQEVYINLAQATYFMQTSTPFDQIIENMVQVKKLEKPFKEQVKQLLENAIYQDEINTEMRARFEEYLSKDWKYYGHELYFDEEVKTLFTVMADFTEVVINLHFKLKKTLLEFQADMMNYREIQSGLVS
ncbi:hypothetical protein D3C87_384380 [compost metagenome]